MVDIPTVLRVLRSYIVVATRKMVLLQSEEDAESDELLMTMTEIELVVLEDMEFARPCVPWNHPCDSVAVWLLVTSCCDVETPLCQKCMERTDSEYQRWSHGSFNVQCKSCKAEFVPTSTDWWRWERL